MVLFILNFLKMLNIENLYHKVAKVTNIYKDVDSSESLTLTAFFELETKKVTPLCSLEKV